AAASAAETLRLAAPSRGRFSGIFDPQGVAAGWEGEGGLRLSPQENAAADRFLAQARDAESNITPVVMGIRGEVPGAETVGYPEFVLKSSDSFKRKLATSLQDNPDMSVDETLSRMKDSVRYTMRLPGEGTAYTDGVNTAMQRFTDAGIKPVGDVRNAWDQPGYQGINSWWRDPSTGHTFEMQFHTPQSFEAKMVTHDLYEQQRLPGISREQRDALQGQQDQIFDAVPRPPGASGIRTPSGPRK
ncbi:MAG: ATP nucleotide 3'-pyrophosphokinase, partial [Jatrophihabitantaceae bacterium]